MFDTSTHPNLTTQTVFNTTRTPLDQNHKEEDIILSVAIPAGVVLLILVVFFMVLYCKWYKRKRQLKRDLTPYYAYDQSEAEVIDGLVYTQDTASVDMLCVVADHQDGPSSPHSDERLLISSDHYPKEIRHQNSVSV